MPDLNILQGRLLESERALRNLQIQFGDMRVAYTKAAEALMAKRQSYLATMLEATRGLEAKRKLLEASDAELVAKLGAEGARILAARAEVRAHATRADSPGDQAARPGRLQQLLTPHSTERSGSGRPAEPATETLPQPAPRGNPIAEQFGTDYDVGAGGMSLSDTPY